MVTIAILYRLYMQKLAEKRNPKNELEKARFVLMTTVLFHLVFYLILPAVFYLIPNGLNPTIKLYSVS